MPDQIKKQLLEEIKQLEYELITELPAEIKKARVTWPSNGRSL
jgi:transcription elongation factor GreA